MKSPFLCVYVLFQHQHHHHHHHHHHYHHHHYYCHPTSYICSLKIPCSILPFAVSFFYVFMFFFTITTATIPPSCLLLLFCSPPISVDTLRLCSYLLHSPYYVCLCFLSPLTATTSLNPSSLQTRLYSENASLYHLQNHCHRLLHPLPFFTQNTRLFSYFERPQRCLKGFLWVFFYAEDTESLLDHY